MKNNIAIEIKDLIIDYGNSIAVNKINLEIEKGDLVTLLGPSGCGKSTTLNALAGLITSTSGKIYFDGTNVTKYSPKERDIGLVFQSYALYPHMTVYKNIAFPLLANDKFKNQIEAKNKEIDVEILKYKYESLGGKNFKKIWDIYKKYESDLIAFSDEIDTINFKAKNVIKNAKELKSQVKTRKDARIKDAAEKALKFITENDKKIEDIKNEAMLIRKAELTDSEKETEINKYREVIAKIEKLNEEKFSAYTEKLNQIKEDYKSELLTADSEKKRILSEVKEWKSTEVERVSNLKKEYIAKNEASAKEAKNEINSVIETKAEFSDEQNAKIKEIESKKNSWKIELDKKVREVAERVGISDQLEKKVTQLSGGQQQRVAISRTLVKSPKVLLLDEPLSNLDAKMRVQTREWIRSLQQDLGITTIFVTHDQEEAMSISDKIVCMSKGHIQQVDEPMEMYHNPSNKFVAGFLGMPQMNFFEEKSKIWEILKDLTKNKKASTFGIRPEHVKSTKEIKKDSIHKLELEVEVLLTESFGREKLVTAEYEKEKIKFFTEDTSLDRGDKVKIGFKKDKIYLFNNVDHGETIGRF